MSSRASAISAIVALALTLPVFAVERSDTQVKETDTDTATTKGNVLTPSELARSRIWGLSEEEWRRYRQLMQGIRGSVSPATLSPIEVLGIHARDAEERRRYAERWARAMREDAERILAFQRAYDAAGKRLYPNEPLIDIQRLPSRNEKTRTLRPEDHVLFFTRPECPACEALWRKLVSHVNEVAVIDVYVAGVDTGDDEAVRRWAIEQGIDPAWVHNRRVTLNHEAGVLERLTQGKGEVPYLLRRRGDDVTVLRPSEL